MPRVACVVQARMGSRRLPGKILRTVGGQAVLTHVLARAKRIPGVDVVHVTTTPAPEDDVVANRCRGAGVGWTRWQAPLPGAPGRNDVLAGYVEAARATGADVVVRVTADCPLLDPAVAGEVLRALRGRRGYASNVDPPSWYDGCDVEAFDAGTLREAARLAGPDEREHVTTWMRRHARVANVAAPGCADWSWLKLSVDDAGDLARVRRVWRALRDRAAPGWRDVAGAYIRAYPPPLLRRALAVYGAGAAADRRVAAYLAGALAGDLSGAPRGPEATARMLGAEDARLRGVTDPDRVAMARYLDLLGNGAIVSSAI